MSKQNGDLTGLNPVKSYTQPKLPSLSEARRDPVLLKKLPARWQNNARIITCMGLIGASLLSLTACPLDELFNDNGRHGGGSHHGGSGGIPVYVDRDTEQDLSDYVPASIFAEDLDLRAHHGGSGAGPFYVIYITEQEALSTIRFMLETAGLRLDATPPRATVDVVTDDFNMITTTFGIDLFDDDKGVAVTHAGNSSWIAGEVAKEFEQQYDRFTTGVFYSPGISPDNEWGYGWDMHYFHDDRSEPSDEEIEEAKLRARPVLEEQLDTQIKVFINFLITEGILTP